MSGKRNVFLGDVASRGLPVELAHRDGDSRQYAGDRRGRRLPAQHRADRADARSCLIHVSRRRPAAAGRDFVAGRVLAYHGVSVTCAHALSRLLTQGRFRMTGPSTSGGSVANQD